MPEAVSKEANLTNENTETQQARQPVEQQQGNTQPEQQQDSIPTDEQVIECGSNHYKENKDGTNTR